MLYHRQLTSEQREYLARELALLLSCTGFSMDDWIPVPMDDWTTVPLEEIEQSFDQALEKSDLLDECDQIDRNVKMLVECLEHLRRNGDDPSTIGSTLERLWGSKGFGLMLGAGGSLQPYGWRAQLTRLDPESVLWRIVSYKSAVSWGLYESPDHFLLSLTFDGYGQTAGEALCSVIEKTIVELKPGPFKRHHTRNPLRPF